MIEVRAVSVDQIALDANNARKHSPRNVSTIAASLEKFGQRRPLVVWKGTVIAGNGTLLAAQSLGWTEVEVTYVPDEWTEEMARAYALADNRTAELSEWDPSLLNAQLIDLNELGFDMFDFGFAGSLRGEFLDDLKPQGGKLASKEDAEEFEPLNYSLPYGFTAAERAVVLSAVKEYRSQEPVSSPTALVRICQLYLDGK